MRGLIERAAPWVVLTVFAAYAFALPGLLAGAAMLGLVEGLQLLREREAMRGAHAIALAKRSDTAEVLEQRIGALEMKVKELATPERLEATKQILERLKVAVPGMRR